MAFYQVFKHPDYRIYKTSVCSKASIFYLATLLLTFIPPLLIAYRSQGFWKKEDYYKEQPNVNYKNEVILYIQTRNDFVAWSSYPNFNRLLDKKIRVPLIRSREEDGNHDGKRDSLALTIEFPIQEKEEILGINIVILFNYQLYRYSYVQMEGLIHIQHSSPVAGSALSVVGDLTLVQKQPLGHKGRDFRFNSPVVEKRSVIAEDFDIYNILLKYSERNVTSRLTDVYSVWTPSYGASKQFTLKLKVHYPEQMIRYTLGFWQLLKWAWIQYVAILWIFLWLFERVKVFIFKNQIIPSIITNSSLKSR